MRLAENGAAALTTMREERPDALLLDIGMPLVNGIEFMREYRKRVEPPHAPIVLISARGDVEALARDLDCDAFVNKPFAIDDVLLTIERVLAERGQAVREHAYIDRDAARRGNTTWRGASPGPTALQ